MAKILSSASCGRGGYPSRSCLDEMSFLTLEIEQVVLMKVVGNYPIFHPQNLMSFCLLELQLGVKF
jgi:hypothetical protein